MPHPHLQLAARYSAGEREAFQEIYDLINPVLASVVRRFVTDESDRDDAMQEAWLRVLSKLDSYHGEASLTTWAYVVTFRRMCERYRAARSGSRDETITSPLDGDPVPCPRAQRSGETLLRNIDLDRALRSLRGTERTLVSLYIESGDTITEAGASLGIGASAAKSVMARAQQKMRRFVNGGAPWR